MDAQLDRNFHSMLPLFFILLLLVYFFVCVSSHLVPKGEMLRNGVHFSLYPVFLP